MLHRNMPPSIWPPLLLLLAAGVGATLATPAPSRAADPSDRPDVAERLMLALPQLGHRNWIVVADMAYPAQSRPGVETIFVGGDQLAAVRTVLAAVDAAPHVRGNVFLDAELPHVAEADAPGIDHYRKGLDALVAKRSVERLPHEEIIGQLDEAARTFRVLVLKTEMTLPYTSVFIQLDCGYWSAAKEERLRAALGKP